MSYAVTDNRYQFIDSDGDIYEVTNGTLKLLDDSGTIELDKVEKSYLEGAVVPGVQRDMSKQLIFQVNIDEQNDSDFRSEYNELLTRARETVTIKDKILSLQTDVRLVERSFSFDEGGQLRGGSFSFTFEQLTPYWEELTYRSASVETGDLTINNGGNLPTSPIITATTPGEQINRFLIKVVEDNFGIGISDLAFGTQGLNSYLIDCLNGEISLQGILRNQKILAGTGFFQLRRGQNTLRMKTTNDALAFTIQWKQRYWI
jgi:hypothetical protein